MNQIVVHARFLTGWKIDGTEEDETVTKFCDLMESGTISRPWGFDTEGYSGSEMSETRRKMREQIGYLHALGEGIRRIQKEKAGKRRIAAPAFYEQMFGTVREELCRLSE